MAPEGRLVPHPQICLLPPQKLRGSQPQHGIAEKFQPFMASAFPQGAVGEGLLNGRQPAGRSPRSTGSGGIQAQLLEIGHKLGEALGCQRGEAE